MGVPSIQAVSQSLQERQFHSSLAGLRRIHPFSQDILENITSLALNKQFFGKSLSTMGNLFKGYMNTTLHYRRCGGSLVG